MLNAGEWWPSQSWTCTAFSPRRNSIVARKCDGACAAPPTARQPTAPPPSQRGTQSGRPARLTELPAPPGHARCERNVAATVARLRRAVAAPVETPSHLHAATAEVEVTPPERDRFRNPQARVSEELREQPRVRSDVREQAPQLVLGQCPGALGPGLVVACHGLRPRVAPCVAPVRAARR